MDYGFNKLGFECLGAYDINPQAVASYNKNYGQLAAQDDLSALNFSIKGVSKVDLVLSGSPCQGFSTLGKRNYDDPRNQLLIRAVEIALQYKAKIFVAENVPGALSGKHGDWWKRANDILLNNGFVTTTLVIKADDYGVPQKRKRIFLVGVRGANTDIFNRVQLSKSFKKKTVGQVLTDGPKESAPEILKGIDLLIAKKIKPGQKLCDVRGGNAAVHTWDIPEVFGYVDETDILILKELMKARRAKSNRVRGHGDGDFVAPSVLEKGLGFGVKRRLRSLNKKGYVRVDKNQKVNLSHTFNGKYRRLSPDGFSPTVDTKFGNPKYFLHPTENRGFASCEAALLQGFPRDYKFIGTESQKMQQVGNAVPPPVSKVLAKYIKDILEAI